MNYDRLIHKRAKEKGLNPQRLTNSEYTALSIEVRDIKAKVIDGIKAVESRIVTSLGFRCVPLVIYEERQSICIACEFSQTFIGGELGCRKCTCTNKFLEAKWQDKKQRCPIGKWNAVTDK